MNVATLGDVTERMSYLAAESLDVDESDGITAILNVAKVADMYSHIVEHDTFDLVDLPNDRKAIGSIWIKNGKASEAKPR